MGFSMRVLPAVLLAVLLPSCVTDPPSPAPEPVAAVPAEPETVPAPVEAKPVEADRLANPEWTSGSDWWSWWDQNRDRILNLKAAVKQREAKIATSSSSQFFGGSPGFAGGARPLVTPPLPAIPPPSTGGTAEPNDNPYGDLFFRHYGVNPFVDTEDDAESTFAMDVDTASYSVTRRFLREGYLPPAESVRVEEFVNSFPTGDPPPDRDAFRLVAEGMPAPYAASRYHLLRLSVRARVVPEKERRPFVLTFVVDVSGSMARQDRLGTVRESLRLLVSRLKPTDEIALVVYGSRGRVLLEHTTNHDRVLEAIESLSPDGSTNAEEGLRLGYAEAGRAWGEGATNRVILCSDGVANVGRTGPDSILEVIGERARQGIDLTTIGFGMGNYNDILMEQLADRGNGNHFYVDTLAEAQRVLVDDLAGTLETVARDAKIQVAFDPAVVARYRLLGYENRDVRDEDFRRDDGDAGEVGSGHAVAALYEVKLHRDAPAGPLGTFRVRYRPARGDGPASEVSLEIGRDVIDGPPSRALRIAAAAAEFAEILRSSYWARDGSLAAVRRDLKALLGEGGSSSRLIELEELVSRAVRLKPAAAGPPPEERPKMEDR